jgi:hypothetical protein
MQNMSSKEKQYYIKWSNTNHAQQWKKISEEWSEAIPTMPSKEEPVMQEVK